MRDTPRLVNGGTWRTIDTPWIVNGGVWRKVQQGWVANGGAWHPLWDLVTLPQHFYNCAQSGGRWAEIGGILWGNSRCWTYFEQPTIRRVVGVVIDVTLSGRKGSWHDSGGWYGASTSQEDGQISWWNCPDWAGVIRSPVLPCNFAAGERIVIQIYGGGSKKHDGKYLDSVDLVDIIYG